MAIIRDETEKLRMEIAALRESVMDLERDLMFERMKANEYKKQVVNLNKGMQRKAEQIKKLKKEIEKFKRLCSLFSAEEIANKIVDEVIRQIEKDVISADENKRS